MRMVDFAIFLERLIAARVDVPMFLLTYWIVV